MDALRIAHEALNRGGRVAPGGEVELVRLSEQLHDACQVVLTERGHDRLHLERAIEVLERLSRGSGGCGRAPRLVLLGPPRVLSGERRGLEEQIVGERL